MTAHAWNHRETIDNPHAIEEVDGPPLVVVVCQGRDCNEITVTRHPDLLRAMGWAVAIADTQGAETWARIAGMCPRHNGTAPDLAELRCGCGERVTGLVGKLIVLGWEVKYVKRGQKIRCPACVYCSTSHMPGAMAANKVRYGVGIETGEELNNEE